MKTFSIFSAPFLRTILTFFAVSFFAGTLVAAPRKGKDISLAEVLESSLIEGTTFYPECLDEINPTKKRPDKIIGKWSWETAEKFDDADFPSDKNPWKDKAKIEELIASMDKFLSGDPKTTKASQAAADFPGVPAEEVDLIERQILIDPSISGWHSTGLWAPPGQKITITLGGKAKFPMSVRIGSQTDFLTMKHLEEHHNGALRRMPRMTNSMKISDGESRERRFEFANPMGGLIYIDVHGVYRKQKPVKITISGAVAAPLYIFGDQPLKKDRQTTAEEWAEQIKNYKAPWGEIQTPRMIFTLPIDMLSEMKLPRKICKKLQRGMALQDWIVAWDFTEDRLRQPMRFVLDRQISVGFGHSGYPAMGYMSWGNCIHSGSLVKNGSWGLWHEFGHNHQGQTPYFCISSDNLTEVTVNVFSTIAQVAGCEVPYERAWDGEGIDEKTMTPSIRAYFQSNETFTTCEDVKVKLYFYVELMRELGFDAFRAMGVEYQSKPFSNLSDQEKWDWVLTTLSEVTNKNLAPYFTAWKINVSKRALSKVAKYPAWDYLADYPKKYTDPNYVSKKESAEKSSEKKAVPAKKSSAPKKSGKEKSASVPAKKKSSK